MNIEIYTSDYFRYKPELIENSLLEGSLQTKDTNLPYTIWIDHPKSNRNMKHSPYRIKVDYNARKDLTIIVSDDPKIPNGKYKNKIPIGIKPIIKFIKNNHNIIKKFIDSSDNSYKFEYLKFIIIKITNGDSQEEAIKKMINYFNLETNVEDYI